jgi:Ca2+-dependent lipid-binding protein
MRGRTTIKRKNLNPVWNERFKFFCSSNEVLYLRVMDWDRYSKDDFISDVTIELIAFPQLQISGGTHEERITLDILQPQSGVKSPAIRPIKLHIALRFEMDS